MLVALQQSEDAEIATAATATLQEQDNSDLLDAARNADTSPAVLDYLGGLTTTREIHEAVILNKNTPDPAIAQLAATIEDGSLLELITLNQQRLVRVPRIIDAILQNPVRTTEAERRARETQTEFFEKERGAKQIAGELRARGKNGGVIACAMADLANKIAFALVRDQVGYEPTRWA